jgi:CelD/BcsL family acetyltransferase involved in cellulose biosynthesis
MIRIDCLRSKAELLALKEQYHVLVKSISNSPIFLDWNWITTWLRVYNRNLSPWILIARHENGQIVGIAPWMIITHRLGPVRLRRLTFIGIGDIYPCHLTVLVQNDQREEVSRAFLAFLDSHRSEWDVVDLDGTAADCAFRQTINAAHGRVFEKKSFDCPFISLPDSWPVYQKSLSKKLRRNLRYYSSRLEKENNEPPSFHRIAADEELDPAIDGLIAMHHKRWHSKGEASAFDDKRFVRFHREMARQALYKGWLRFFQLKVADQVLAALYAFRYRDVFYAYQIGFDPSWSRYSPGRLLIAHVVREAIHEGARVFDWLREEQRYKRAWANDTQTNYRLLFSNNLRGQLLVNYKSYGHIAKSIIQKHYRGMG